MPLHIVFLELVIDPACSIAFESEPEHSNIMNRPPRDPASRMFDLRMISFGLMQGFVLLVITFERFSDQPSPRPGKIDARAISFTTLVLGYLAWIWTNRSRTRTIPELFRSRNVALAAVTVGALALLLFVLYLPGARNLFQFSTLHPNDLAVYILLAIASVTWFEIAKLWNRRKEAH